MDGPALKLLAENWPLGAFLILILGMFFASLKLFLAHLKYRDAQEAKTAQATIDFATLVVTTLAEHIPNKAIVDALQVYKDRMGRKKRGEESKP